MTGSDPGTSLPVTIGWWAGVTPDAAGAEVNRTSRLAWSGTKYRPAAAPAAAMFLPYVSSGFVPVETLPEWLQGLAQHQPATPLIESVRALLTGSDPGSSLPVAAAWWAGLMLVGFVVASRLFATRAR